MTRRTTHRTTRVSAPEFRHPGLTVSDGRNSSRRLDAAPADAALLKIEAVHSQQAVINVIQFLNENNLQMTSLEILEPNLEGVFLHLTGSTLVD